MDTTIEQVIAASYRSARAQLKLETLGLRLRGTDWQ